MSTSIPINTSSFVQEIANRMIDPLEVQNTLSPESSNLGGNDFSIYSGGLIILSELDHLFPDEKWDRASYLYVLKIKERLEQSFPNRLSLFGGLSEVCFALSQASKNGLRYSKLQNTLNSYLIKKVQEQYIEPFKLLLEKKEPIPQQLYDTISGLSGIGMYVELFRSSPPFENLLLEIIELLVKYTFPIKVQGEEVPGWFLSSELQFLERERARYPKGNFNLGLSHGIAGVLSFLSITSLNGFSSEGQREAIERISLWIKERRCESPNGFFWETVIAFEEESSYARERGFSGRDAWCYGTPGVTRSLFLAGKALKDESLQKFALDSFKSVFKRSLNEWNLSGPGICHGFSGLLLITHLMAKDTNDPTLIDSTTLVKELLFQSFNLNYSFGFKDLEKKSDGAPLMIDKMDLLEGVSGTLLTLLSLESQTSFWHLPLLLDHRHEN